MWLVCVWSPSPLAYTERHCIRNASQIHQTATCNNKYSPFIPTNTFIFCDQTLEIQEKKLKILSLYYYLSLNLTSWFFRSVVMQGLRLYLCVVAFVFALTFTSICLPICAHLCLYLSLDLRVFVFGFHDFSTFSSICLGLSHLSANSTKGKLWIGQNIFEKVKIYLKKSKYIWESQNIFEKVKNASEAIKRSGTRVQWIKKDSKFWN